MNRLMVALLSVLIVLVAALGVLQWRWAERAHEDALRQECLQRSQATAIIAVLGPALVQPAEDGDVQEARLEAITALGAQADAC